MKRSFLALTGLFLAASFAVPVAIEACGDKFMMAARGLMFSQAYEARYPGAVLIYLPAGPLAGEYGKVAATLTRAGHRVTLVSDTEDVAPMMAKISADVVLAPVAAAQMIDGRAKATTTPPVVLPVLASGDKPEVTACKRQLKVCDLKLKDDLKITDTVNKTMTQRTKTRTAKK